MLEAELAAHLATRQELSAALARVAELERERDEERAEVERLKATAFTAQNAAIDLAQQVERLTKERDEAIERAHRSGLLFDDARKQTTEALAEVERLREALRHVEVCCLRQQRAAEEHKVGVGLPYLQFALDSVRAALAGSTIQRPQPMPTGVPGPGLTVAEKKKRGPLAGKEKP